jgi:hypothetical protein
MLQSSFFDQLDASLNELVPAHRVECHGAWSTSRRRTYASPSRQGTGAGPYVEVIDARWGGAVTAEVEISAIAFLATACEIFWVKTPVVATTLEAQITLSAYADSTPQRATLSASLGGAVLPGVPIAAEGRLEDVCAAGPQVLTAGRVARLAESKEASIFAVVLPREALKMGRNHLWRLRDDLAARLTPMQRELLTRRRSGTVMPDPGAARSGDGEPSRSER